MFIKTFRNALAIISIHRNLQKDEKEKYFMFIRPDVDNINPYSMFICGITIAPIRLIGFTLILAIANIILRMICWG